MERLYNTVVYTTIFPVISGLYSRDIFSIIPFFLNDHLSGGRRVEVFHDDVYHPPECDVSGDVLRV